MAIVTNVGTGSGGRGSVVAHGSAGRVFGFREHGAGAETSDAEAYGEAVWFWHPLLVSNRRWCCRPTGSDNAVKPAVTVTKRNSSPGSNCIVGGPVIGRPQGWRGTRHRLRRLAALTPSAHRSLVLHALGGVPSAECALDQLTTKRLASHFSPRAIMMLRTTISLRMQATRATFGGLPLATRRR